MENIIIQYSENDLELHNELVNIFDEELDFIRIKSFEGMDVIIQVTIPLTAIAINIIIGYFTIRKDKVTEQRTIYKDGKTISIHGYDANDAKMIIKSLDSMKNN